MTADQTLLMVVFNNICCCCGHYHYYYYHHCHCHSHRQRCYHHYHYYYHCYYYYCSRHLCHRVSNSLVYWTYIYMFAYSGSHQKFMLMKFHHTSSSFHKLETGLGISHINIQDTCSIYKKKQYMNTVHLIVHFKKCYLNFSLAW